LKGKMQIATGRLRLNKVGSDIPVVGLTPAEAVLLHLLHQPNNGGSTFGEEFDKINVSGTAKSLNDPKKDRTDNEELRRLTNKYIQCVNKAGQRIVKLVWPGVDVRLPQKFDEIKWSELQYDGVEVAPLNYSTGAPLSVTPTPPAK
jgi:hypothetical protein